MKEVELCGEDHDERDVGGAGLGDEEEGEEIVDCAC